MRTYVLFFLYHTAIAISHWVVTEDGMIKTVSLEDSHYMMRRPYDLVEWLKQEQRLHLLNTLENELSESDQTLENSPAKDDNFIEKFYQSNHACVKAGKPLQEFDLYASASYTLATKSIDGNSLLNDSSDIDWRVLHLEVPDCVQHLQMDFSSAAFEHLHSIRARHVLKIVTDILLYRLVVPMHLTPDQYGHLINKALKNNSTSWVLYNMAAYFWRIRGNAGNAIECIRRSLHYAPRQHQDIVMINLANILHAAKTIEDATVVLKNALAINSNIESGWNMLGNIYVLLGDFDNAKVSYNTGLSLTRLSKSAKSEFVVKLSAIECHGNLAKSLEEQEKVVSITMERLRHFELNSDNYAKAKEKVVKEEATLLSKQKCEHRYALFMKNLQNREKNKKSRFCGKRDDSPNCVKFDSSKGKTVGNKLNKKTDKTKGSLKPTKSKKINVTPLSKRKLPSELDYLRRMDYPTPKECFNFSLPSKDGYPLKLQMLGDRGVSLLNDLTVGLGLLKGESHPLPWYPPQCTLFPAPEPSSKSADHLYSIKSRAVISSKSRPISDPQMLTVLFSAMETTEAKVEDIGQRILSALHKKVGPSWAMYFLASVFWRYQGNFIQCVECLRRSLYHVPNEFRDLPLLQLASLLYRYGRFDDALSLSKEAIKIGNMVPHVQLFYAHLLAGSNNFSAAITHYTNTLLLDPSISQIVIPFLSAAKCRHYQEKQFQVNKQRSISDAIDSSNTEIKIRKFISAVVDVLWLFKICTNDDNCEKNVVILLQHDFTLPHIEVMFIPTEDAGNSFTANYSLFWLPESPFSAADCIVFNDTKRTLACAPYTEKSNTVDMVLSMEKFLHDYGVVCSQYTGILKSKLSKVYRRQIGAITRERLRLHTDAAKCGVDQFLLFPTTQLSLTERFLDYNSFNLDLSDYDVEAGKLARQRLVGSKEAYLQPHCQLSMEDFLRIPHLNTLFADQENVLKLFDSNCSFVLNHPEVHLAEEFERVVDYYRLSPTVQVHRWNNMSLKLEAIHNTSIHFGEHDWMLASIAAMYWRMKGNHSEAFRCFLLAYDWSPDKFKDTSMISLANLFLLKNYATRSLAIQLIQKSFYMVNPSGIGHVTLANIYVAEGDLLEALKHYEIAIKLEATMDFVVRRLEMVKCMLKSRQDVVAKPPSV